MKTQGVTLAGSVIGGILASACCIGPLVFALLGISGAAFAQRFSDQSDFGIAEKLGLTGDTRLLMPADLVVEVAGRARSAGGACRRRSRTGPDPGRQPVDRLGILPDPRWQGRLLYARARDR